MFTGLIEFVGTVRSLSHVSGGGARIAVEIGPLAEGTRTGDSIAVEGVCLTVVTLDGTVAAFDAVPETLRRTSIGSLKSGAKVNLERALLPSTRAGGHFVQGHVDGTASVTHTVEGGRWAEWHFKLNDAALAAQIVEKGSIAIDGISLTVAGCAESEGQATFWVALIPETLERTTIAAKKAGATVNIETDILGKYVLSAFNAYLPRMMQMAGGKPLTAERLRELGY